MGARVVISFDSSEKKGGAVMEADDLAHALCGGLRSGQE